MIPKLKISIQTIKNTFTLFKHFVIKRNPWFKKVILAHLLRHTFITNLFTNGFSAEEIIFYTGHKSPEILRQTYISKWHNYYYELYQDKINNKTKKAAKIEQK
ncbi:Phage integrase family [Mycoplasmopsis maculosa]|uniref:Phage integrase family n=1 Tax=Mycoplasmopsis maculosa TaxID=114885 RepID=A0A449B3T9_9BACT|nr:Phage integrase family [Mycoplasmopsis maculosa]